MNPVYSGFNSFKSYGYPGPNCNHRRPGNYDGRREDASAIDDDDQSDESIDEVGLQFELDKSGIYSHSLVVPPEFYGMIIGTKGSNRNRLEFKTRCRMFFPKRNASIQNVIVLKSISRENICRARKKILGIVNNARSKLKPNHFISIPLNDPALMAKFENFKRQVLNRAKNDRAKYKGISEMIFQDPRKLHLTFCVLTILSQTDEKRHIIQVLDNLYQTKIQSIVRRKPIIVKIKGLASFDQDTNFVDVVYAKIEPNEDLQYIAELIAEELRKTICITHDRPRVQLHLTLLNSNFVYDWKPKEGILRDRKSKKEKISAQELINKFGDYDFGQVEAKSIELSIMSSFGESGYYQSAHSLPL